MKVNKAHEYLEYLARGIDLKDVVEIDGTSTPDDHGGHLFVVRLKDGDDTCVIHMVRNLRTNVRIAHPQYGELYFEAFPSSASYTIGDGAGYDRDAIKDGDIFHRILGSLVSIVKTKYPNV